MSDPILDKLDVILNCTYRGACTCSICVGVREKLRGLLAEVAIEYVKAVDWDGLPAESDDEIRKRFGVAPPSEEEKT